MSKHAARHRKARAYLHAVINAAGVSEVVRFDAEAVEWILAKDGAAGDGADKPKRFSMTAYTGGPLQVSAYGPPVVIDLSGLKAKAPVPILFNHDMAQIVGHADEVEIAEAGLKLAGIISGAGPAALEVQTSAGRGFPWRASVGARPDKMEFIAEGTETIVNGKRISGPLYVARKATLGEVSFVAVGADGRTSVKVAASAAPPTQRKDAPMTFDQWIQALGFNPEEIREDQKALLQAKYDAETKAAEIKAAALKPDGDAGAAAKRAVVEAPKFDLAAVALAYEIHATAVQALTAKYAGKIDGPKLAEIQAKTLADSLSLKAKALTEQWSEPRFSAELVRPAAMHDVELQRAERPRGPSIHSSSRDFSSPVIEAAFCRAISLPDRAKHFKPEVLEAADRHKGIGLQELLLIQANAAGYTGRQRIKGDNIREILQYAFIRAAGFSTIDVAGILSNVANKSLLVGYMAVQQTWRQIAAIKPVNDFKTVTRYRLTDSLQYEEVTATGQIPHGELGEESYTNLAKTYAKMLSLTRKDIINDDLGAFDALRQRLGRGGATKINDLFWSNWLTASNAGTFWTAARGNLVASSALGLDGLGAGVKAFRNMPVPGAATVLDAADSARKHGNLDLTPDRILVGSTLEPTADSYFVSELISDTTATTKRATGNIYRNRFQVVAAAALENARYTGHSASTWWMACNPADLASAEVCFLDGIEVPTVESAEADFDVLGILFRGYHDFGVAMSEYCASVKLTA